MKYIALVKKLLIIEDTIETRNIVFNDIDLILSQLIFNMNNASKTQNELPIEVNKLIIEVSKFNISANSIFVLVANE